MATLPIVRLGHPALRTRADPVPKERIGSADLKTLVEGMVETMRDAEGVGLAAPQVGQGLQIFVYEAIDEESPNDSIALRAVINPMIEPIPGEMIWDWEGCLSIPDLRGLVPRHPQVRVRGFDASGQRLDYVAAGFEARIVQHEFDHLNGVLFLDRMRDLRSLAFYEEWDEFLRESAHPEGGGRPE